MTPRESPEAAAGALLAQLQAAARPGRRAQLGRVGIPLCSPWHDDAWGVPMPAIRALAKPHRHQPAVAQRLWEARIHEAKLLATLVASPKAFSYAEATHWIGQLYAWDLCDQLCINLLQKPPFALELAHGCVAQPPEFVRRAGFALLTAIAIHHKHAPDAVMLDMLPCIEAHADDSRNFVKKAANWCLRTIGKRNERLHGPALALAERLASHPHPAARWVGRDALRELLARA